MIPGAARPGVTACRPPVVAVVGATASGKSDLALDLAADLGGEVVNTDAMQVYRGMDVGTAKLPLEERRGVAHHLLDVWDVVEPANVADFQRRAREVVEDCRARGVVPVLVGGSALYTRAVLDRFDFPGTDPSVRARWQRELEAVGAVALHDTLRERDPEAAEAIEASNARRVVRALEVGEITGRPFEAALPSPEYVASPTVQIGVRVARDVLDARIAERVHAMFASGLVEEVRRLADAGLREGLTASRALGYQQVLDLIDGRHSEAEAIESTILGTRRLVRRQESWLRRDPRIVWVAGDPYTRRRLALEAVTRSVATDRPDSS